jgi:uncharacterized protein (TIGR02145 family)
MKKIMPLLVIVCFIIGIAVMDSCKKDPVIPTLTTSIVTNVTINSFTSGGVITKDGGAEVTARGVCYGTGEKPSVSDSHTTDDKGVGSFVSNVTALTPNTLYHVRAYATNKAGTAYGEDITITTTPIVVPTLTTTAVTSISLTTAVSGGNISADGNAAVTAKGICWATTTAPTTANSFTSDGTGTGSYTSNLTGLQPNTTYYVRAYATNSAGTAYGNEVSFLTSPIVVPTLTTVVASGVTLTSAITGGTITTDGGGAITAKGTCWALTANPTISGSKTTDGTGPGSFTSTISGLVPGTTYHIRAYATNSAGTAYGDDLTFVTNPIVVPTLTTATATSITLTSAIAGGNITSDGGGAITAKGTCYGTTANPTVAGSKTNDGTGSGSFTSPITGLTAGVTYHIRAYATNSAGTAYGNDLTFTTTSIVVPTLTTTTQSAVTLTTATSGGNITADGGGAVSARGVCWSTAAAPTTANSKTIDGSGTGSFISNLTSLLPGTLYHVRAYATNSAGTAYGNEITFTTTAVGTPTLTTTTVTAITLNSATSGGNVLTDGGASVSAKGICWSTSTGPTTANSKTNDGTGTGSFISNMTSLLPGTTYYVRAYATNTAGTAYGNEVSFTTSQIVVPTLSTTAVTSITYTTAVSGGNVTADGGGPVTMKGVCWALTAAPTTSNFTLPNVAGTGAFVSNLTGLTAGTTYHLRAYAINSAGTAYGNEVVFTTTAIVVPTVTTAVITSIGYTNATSGGNVTADGGGTVTEKGVVWALTSNPTIGGLSTSDGTGTGSFVSSITGLTPGTLYHVRAYATNSAGTAYGTDRTFTTDPIIAPTVTTAAVSAIGVTAATSGGDVLDAGGGVISAKGVVWATHTAPVISSDVFSDDGTGTASYTSTVTPLLAGNKYYVRAYATNTAGTSYGAEYSFNTKIADIDGNTYNTVTVGTQVWMAENLKTTKWQNGNAIPTTTADITAIVSPEYQWAYNDNSGNIAAYGRLYTWAAATDVRKICPTDWHVPTNTEWESMKTFLGGEAAAGGKIKEAGLSHWASPNTNATNETGFTARPGGYRMPAGTYVSLTISSYFWSSTVDDASLAWGQGLHSSDGDMLQGGYVYNDGVSIRCLRDY